MKCSDHSVGDSLDEVGKKDTICMSYIVNESESVRNILDNVAKVRFVFQHFRLTFIEYIKLCEDIFIDYYHHSKGT